MKVKSFGCSFVFGTELSDDCNSGLLVNASKLTWPAHVANYLKMEYQCFAKGGAGNLLILERLLNHIAKNEQDFYIINWTWIDRFDYVEIDPASDNDWMTLRPTIDSLVAKNYYSNLHSEFKDKFTTLAYIQLAITTLEKKKCPFIMTFMDDLLLDQKWNIKPSVIDLQNSVEPYLSTFDGKNFLKWSKDLGYPISNSMHPLDDAHRAAADLIISNLNTVVKNNSFV